MVFAAHSSPTSLQLPITNRLLGVLLHGLSSPSFNHVMFWATCCTAFFGFLDMSEFMCFGNFKASRHLAHADIHFNLSVHYCLCLKSSKTDPLLPRFYCHSWFILQPYLPGCSPLPVSPPVSFVSRSSLHLPQWPHAFIIAGQPLASLHSRLRCGNWDLFQS